MEMLQISVSISSKPKFSKDVEMVLDDILKHENLIEGVKINITRFIITMISSLRSHIIKYTINNVSSKKIRKLIKILKEETTNDLKKEMLLTLLYFDYWRIKYYEEEGLSKYIEKVADNIRTIYSYIELSIWYLLYLKNKNKVMEYEEYIKKLIDGINDAMVEFIPEDSVSEDELRAIKESLKEEWKGIENLKF